METNLVNNIPACLTCRFWEGNYTVADHSPEITLENDWRVGRCTRINAVIDIEAKGGWDGAYIAKIETPASFGCRAWKGRDLKV